MDHFNRQIKAAGNFNGLSSTFGTDHETVKDKQKRAIAETMEATALLKTDEEVIVVNPDLKSGTEDVALPLSRKRELYQLWIEKANTPLDKEWRKKLTPEDIEFIKFLDSGVPIVKSILSKRAQESIGNDTLDQIFSSLGNSEDVEGPESKTRQPSKTTMEAWERFQKHYMPELQED